jgi:chemotaxis protein CheX
MPAALQPDILLPGLVELPDVLDLKAATPLAVELLAFRGKPLQLDGARVQRLGGLCLQVLLSAAKTWNADDISFGLVNPSEDLIEALTRLGVSSADFTRAQTPNDQDHTHSR